MLVLAVTTRLHQSASQPCRHEKSIRIIHWNVCTSSAKNKWPRVREKYESKNKIQTCTVCSVHCCTHMKTHICTEHNQIDDQISFNGHSKRSTIVIAVVVVVVLVFAIVDIIVVAFIVSISI